MNNITTKEQNIAVLPPLPITTTLEIVMLKNEIMEFRYDLEDR